MCPLHQCCPKVTSCDYALCFFYVQIWRSLRRVIFCCHHLHKAIETVNHSVPGTDLPQASLIFLATQLACTFTMTNYQAVTLTEGSQCYFIPVSVTPLPLSIILFFPSSTSWWQRSSWWCCSVGISIFLSFCSLLIYFIFYFFKTLPPHSCLSHLTSALLSPPNYL